MLQNKTGSMIQCARKITAQEIEEIQETIDLCSRLSRTELAQTISENLQWYTASGTNKVDACFKLLKRLEAEGVLKLPEKRSVSKPIVKSLIPPTEKTEPQHKIDCKLRELGPVELEVVNDKKAAKLWKEYLSRYHYLGYKKPFGFYLRYFFKSNDMILGCALFSGAAKSIGVRDRWIGWTEKQRLRNIAWVINNSRYLIFPWVKIRNLASHVLGQISKQISQHWLDRWGYSPVLMETFVNPNHYRGICYKASNWQYLGMTTGQGLVRKGKTYSTCPKKIFIKPLVKDYQDMLCSDNLVGRAQI